MPIDAFWGDYAPQIVPRLMIGKLTHKVVIKKDHTRNDGTNAIYLQLFKNKQRKRIPLNIAVPLKDFNLKTGKVKPSHPRAHDLNLIIGKATAHLNSILVNYRLSDIEPTLEAVFADLANPSIRANFNAFAAHALERQKNVLEKSTFAQQKGALSKLKKFKDPIYFSEIDDHFVNTYRAYCKKTLKNGKATVESSIKNFKKMLHLANDAGIKTPLRYTDFKVKKMTGERTFLLPAELVKLFEYLNSSFISPTHKCVLKRFLFSCFTGIRISDSERITADNFVGDHLVLTTKKGGKFIRVKLNATAKSLIQLPEVFTETFTREHLNRELKAIALVTGIKKRLYFHCSRHTFATNFIAQGGNVVHLQKLLGHSKIDETMIYVHLVQSVSDIQVDLLDNIVK